MKIVVLIVQFYDPIMSANKMMRATCQHYNCILHFEIINVIKCSERKISLVHPHPSALKSLAHFHGMNNLFSPIYAFSAAFVAVYPVRRGSVCPCALLSCKGIGNDFCFVFVWFPPVINVSFIMKTKSPLRRCHSESAFVLFCSPSLFLGFVNMHLSNIWIKLT